ncbi:TonB-dependent receptor plug domain-containing protein [Sphingomonas sp.]|uniref:TonB-dependent receptor plug domain-containing protein n=1 Tax=Sphingomonas sp. TaxID=28214 RepID=UPI001B25621E|nr:TonB-dependent receptor plug domain-containing protein [Sphingomonas sp.]MBO9712547.1 TonB-dependent receptor [Sphingomonas sp.]
MKKPLALGTLLLVTSQLVAPAALAQAAGGEAPQTAAPAAAPADQDQAPQDAEVSSPGYDETMGEEIVVIGRNIPNTVRATPQVVSVLSTEDIARTGEGDIASALTRVTGLSVVGNGFVYVRGLGDRYSSALLNGSPLPSPEPLRRSVPLDIFPTTIVGSAMVQKSYSANYAGEFGGGVINLTTKAVPEKSFVEIGGSVGYDSTTTGQFGFTYDGGKYDWTGYDSGERKVPDFITAAPGGTGVIPTAQVVTLSGAQTSLLQQNDELPVNFSGNINIGQVFDMGGARLGLVATGGISNNWRTRDTTQQDAVSSAGTIRNDFHTQITDNRAIVNGLLGLGLEFGEQKIRLTNVYIHDTLKQARGSTATVYNNSSGNPRFLQDTEWFERQLFETQAVGEFKFGDVSLDLRGAYANSKRESPYERSFDYLYNPTYQAYQATNTFGPFATLTFSDLNEDLWSGQADLGVRLPTDRPMKFSSGFYYSDAKRTSTRLPFVYQTNVGGAIPFPYNLLRPDLLLSSDVLTKACDTLNDGVGPGCVRLKLTGDPQGFGYDASLRVAAGYMQLEAEPWDGVRGTVGVRYERATERVQPTGGAAPILLQKSYWLPAATLTWNFVKDMQFRVHASKTIARPQFRELAPQQFQDYESDRLFFGNPRLQDTELTNYEARYEWFFGRNERITAAGFYKDIKRPIEQVGFRPTPDARLQTGFSYVPSAQLYGGEIEAQKYVPLSGLGGGFFASRRLVLIANYTYTQSKIDASDECVPQVAGTAALGSCAAGFAPAKLLYRDGAPMTGQSDHLVNAQIGIEDTDSLSQLTMLFNYASDRVTNRGPSDLSGLGFLPDIIEHPGIRLDVVARQGFKVFGTQLEVKLEARNLTGQGYEEAQTFADGKKVYINRYKLGRMFSAGLNVTF